MILRSYRDVEIELRKLIASIDELRQSKNATSASGLTNADVIALINTYSKRQSIVNTVENTPQDLDSSNAGTLIIHKLVHQFLEKVIFDGLVEILGDLNVTGEIKTGAIVIPDEWRIDNDVSNNTLRIIFNDGTNSFLLELLASGAVVTSWALLFDGNIGSSGRRVFKTWTQELSVLPGLTPSVAGQVLTAIDTVGNTAWQTLPVNSNVGSLTEVVLSSNWGIPNAQTGVPALNATLPAIGVYLIIFHCNVTFQVNDSALEFYIQVIGSATYTNAFIREGKPVADATEISVSRSWRVNATGVGVFVQIVGIKAGSGGSFINAPATMQVQRVS